MATPSQTEFLLWPKRALDQGQVEIEPILDTEGRVMKIGIIAAPGGGLAALPDPRRVGPMPVRRARPL